MRHRALAAAAAALVVMSVVSGCTSKSYACRGDVCNVAVRGQASFDDLGPGWRVRVVAIDAQGLTLEVEGDRATVPPGQTTQVGPTRVTVTKLGDGAAEFQIRGS